MIYTKNFYSYRYNNEFINEMTALLIISLTDLYKGLNEAIIQNEPKIFIQQLTRSHFVLVLINNENLGFTASQIKKVMLERACSEISFQLLDSFRKSYSLEISRLTDKLGHFEKHTRYKTSFRKFMN